jgi:UPF0176 protein
MARLHNNISHEELKEKLLQDNTPRTTISFYKYFTIEDALSFRNKWWEEMTTLGVMGRIYIAQEGVNAQISVPNENLEPFTNYLKTQYPFENIRLNMAADDDGKSFFVLKIKVRDKIVADGITDETFDASKTGKYLNAKDYNELSKDPETIVVDMRNHYEYEVGHFKNAIEVPSETFREQLPMAAEMLGDKKDKNIIMYCTGGIRCEKASAYMKHHGFENVFHVEGGIINYANQLKPENLESEFIGKNFVFDQRLGERITEDIIAQCHQCGEADDTHVNCANEGCHLLFIQCENCKTEMQGCCSKKCQEIIQLPEEEQAVLRAGQMNGNKIFNKSRDAKLMVDKRKQ